MYTEEHLDFIKNHEVIDEYCGQEIKLTVKKVKYNSRFYLIGGNFRYLIAQKIAKNFEHLSAKELAVMISAGNKIKPEKIINKTNLIKIDYYNSLVAKEEQWLTKY